MSSHDSRANYSQYMLMHAHASKESLRGLQIQASSDWNLAGLWPYCWFAKGLCETSTRLRQLEQKGSPSRQRTIKRKAKGHISFWSFLMCYWFYNPKFSSWRPAELQVLQHPTHSACSTFKQQQNIFTHELTKCPVAYSPKTEKKKKK